MTKSRQVKMSGLLAAGVIPSIERTDSPRPFGVPDLGSQNQSSGTPPAVSGDQNDGPSRDIQNWSQDLAERDTKSAERDGIIEQLKSDIHSVQKIRLSDVDDSPYQPRTEYNPVEIDALAKTLAAGTQADPIKVRKTGNRYELISGHRRKRAALSLGWSDIKALVEIRSDAEAELETMLLSIGNEKLSDYELAKMYQRALDKGYCKTRDKTAAMFGVSPSAVTGRLDMLELPAPVLELLEGRPSLFAYPVAAMLKKLVQQYPQNLEIIVSGVRRLTEEGAKQNSLKGWILDAIAQKDRKKAPTASKLMVTKDGREVFTTKKTATSVTVAIKGNGIDPGQFEKDLHAWLTDYATRQDIKEFSESGAESH